MIYGTYSLTPAPNIKDERNIIRWSVIAFVRQSDRLKTRYFFARSGNQSNTLATTPLSFPVTVNYQDANVQAIIKMVILLAIIVILLYGIFVSYSS